MANLLAAAMHIKTAVLNLVFQNCRKDIMFCFGTWKIYRLNTGGLFARRLFRCILLFLGLKLFQLTFQSSLLL